MTKEAKLSQLLDSGLSTKTDILVNPYIVRLKCDGDGDFGLLSQLTPCFQEKFLWLII